MVLQFTALVMGQPGQRWRPSMLRAYMPLTSHHCLITKVCFLSNLACCLLKLWSRVWLLKVADLAILWCAGVAVRSGHHCTQPLHHHLGIAASARASAYLYNTHAEIDSFIAALKESIQFFRDAGM